MFSTVSSISDPRKVDMTDELLAHVAEVDWRWCAECHFILKVRGGSKCGILRSSDKELREGVHLPWLTGSCSLLHVRTMATGSVLYIIIN